MKTPLVDFDQTPSPAPLWDAAGHDVSAFGAALDRVFGESSDVHVIEHFATANESSLLMDDPLVLLANLMDGLGLPDPSPVTMPEFAAVYDFAPEGFNSHEHWVYDAHA